MASTNYIHWWQAGDGDWPCPGQHPNSTDDLSKVTCPKCRAKLGTMTEEFGATKVCKTCKHSVNEHTEDGCEHSGCKCMALKEETTNSYMENSWTAPLLEVFGNMGLHIIQYPSGRFGYVGSVPPALGEMVPASSADVMAGRAHQNPHDKKWYAIKWPAFNTAEEAQTFAKSKGFDAKIGPATYNKK